MSRSLQASQEVEDLKIFADQPTFDPNEIRGTAYVDGSLVWGYVSKKLFFSAVTPFGVDKWGLYRLQKWDSPKRAVEERAGFTTHSTAYSPY